MHARLAAHFSLVFNCISLFCCCLAAGQCALSIVLMATLVAARLMLLQMLAPAWDAGAY
jgi:hypothetical protein